MHDRCFNGDHGDIIFNCIAQIYTLIGIQPPNINWPVTFSRNPIFCHIYTSSDMQWWESSILLSAFFCELFFGTLSFSAWYVVLNSTIVTYIIFLPYFNT